MASNTRSGAGGKGPSRPDDVPREFANVTPQIDHSFTLQAVMELQKTVASIATKTDRLIDDVEKQAGKVDALRLTVARWTGMIFVGSVVVSVLAKFLLDYFAKH